MVNAEEWATDSWRSQLRLCWSPAKSRTSFQASEVLQCEEPQLGELSLRFVPGLFLVPLEQPRCHHLAVPAHGRASELDELLGPFQTRLFQDAMLFQETCGTDLSFPAGKKCKSLETLILNSLYSTSSPLLKVLFKEFI